MKFFYINTADGRHKIKWPSIDKVKLSNVMAFEVWEEEILLWMSDMAKEEKLHEESPYYLYLLSRACSDYLDFDLTKLLRFNAKELLDDDGLLLTHVLQKHVDGELEDLQREKGTINNIVNLFEKIRVLKNSYEFKVPTTKNFEFQYKGRKWQMPHYIRTAITGDKILSEITTIESVECLQVRRQLTKIKKDFHKASKRNPKDHMSSRYTLTLKAFSCLIREKGKEVKTDESEFEKDVIRKVGIFKDAPMKVIKDVFFFSIFTTSNWKQIQKTTISSMSLKILMRHRLLITKQLSSQKVTGQSI